MHINVAYNQVISCVLAICGLKYKSSSNKY